MHKRIATAFGALLLGAAMVGAAAAAEVTPEVQALLADAKGDKRAAVARRLDLSEAEAKRFWPIYDDYQRRLDQTNRKRNVLVVEVVGANRPVSDVYARRLATELLEIENAEVAAERRMQKQVVKALPALKAARYLQIENKLRAANNYEIAMTIPLVK